MTGVHPFKVVQGPPVPGLALRYPFPQWHLAAPQGRFFRKAGTTCPKDAIPSGLAVGDLGKIVPSRGPLAQANAGIR